MRILFDQGTPVPLRRSLPNHAVSTLYELGWSEHRNGDLLRAAEGRFDVLVTTDRNLKHEQNLAARRLAVVVLLTTSWPRIARHASAVVAAIERARPGDYVEVPIPM